ncbi:hypothetical protein BgiBS90_033442 [Biomphalaria glabrata]|nr:hypothetical protein BgiBS90_033442 [Biomphalaria glabrata]
MLCFLFLCSQLFTSVVLRMILEGIVFTVGLVLGVAAGQRYNLPKVAPSMKKAVEKVIEVERKFRKPPQQ